MALSSDCGCCWEDGCFLQATPLHAREPAISIERTRIFCFTFMPMRFNQGTLPVLVFRVACQANQYQSARPRPDAALVWKTVRETPAPWIHKLLFHLWISE